ncbi:MAG: NifB/NifX family molybdenum-iron cluster-binding protein [Nitrososphaerales archaeon]
MDELEEINRRNLGELMSKMERGKTEGGERMKVCVPTIGNRGLDEYVSEHFGRAPTFTIVDLATNQVKVVPNTSEHMGGTGHPPQILANAGVDVMLCSGLGPRAIHMFEQFGIEVYVGVYGTVREAIQAWQAGKLQVATDENACRMHRHRE